MALMTEPKEETGTERHWLLWIFGAVVALFGLAMTGGGLWLVTLDGSWYYLLAGIGLVLAGIELMRGRIAGAWWFAAVFAATLLWTIWEAGLDYWRWIPRFGLIVVFAFILALLLPKLRQGPSVKVAGTLAVLLALIFIGFFALAFLPHGVTKADWNQASPASEAAEYPFADDAFEQPADAPADGDWAACGRSNSALRFSPLTQIDPDNVATLTRAWVYPRHRPRDGRAPVEGRAACRWTGGPDGVRGAGGRQYLVIMAGGHHFMETPNGDYVIAYALPE